jgi:hypothetical protein
VNFQQLLGSAFKFHPAVVDPFSEKAEANACVNPAGSLQLDVMA